MKNLHRFLSVAAAVIAIAPIGALAQTVLNGNGSGGFGGPLGGGTLTITDNTTTGMIQFALHTGTGSDFNDIAFYLSTGTTTTGVSDTSSITDTGDEGRISISGVSRPNGNKSLVNFASGFSANFAVALDSKGNANLFQIVSGQGYLTYVSGANYSNPSAGNYDFSINGAALGLAQNSNATIGIVATLSNSNADNNDDGTFYRSNETIGASNVDNNSQGNLGNTGTLIYSGFDTFITQVPEPATWLAGGLLVVAAGWTASRSRRLAA